MALRAKRYFEDYTVETVLQNGKAVQRYVYKGDLYARDLPPASRNRERRAYIPLALAAGLLLLCAMARPAAPNLRGPVAACSLLALIPAFCVVEGAVEAFFRKGDLKKEDYRERLLMLRVMPIAAAALAVVMALGYAWDAIARRTALAADLQAMACVLAAAALYAGLAAREVRVPYRVIKAKRDDDGPGADGAADQG